jgi:hypothetical protein
MNDKIKVKIGDGSTREGSWNVISPILPCILEFKELTFFLKHNGCSFHDQSNDHDWEVKIFFYVWCLELLTQNIKIVISLFVYKAKKFDCLN